MKKCGLLSFVLVFLLLVTAVSGQDLHYYSAEGLTFVGKGFDTPSKYHRVDSARYCDMPMAAKTRYCQSAGLAVAFKTNSNTIAAKWKTARGSAGTNMTLIMQRGLDLYIKVDGRWVYAGVGNPTFAKEHSSTIVANMADGEKECLLYLPMFDVVRELEIGVDEGSEVKAIESPFKYKVAIYGSSITHGASSSRAGLAYPAIMSRNTGISFINLGISGSALMEMSVAEMLVDVDPDVFILDCIPNPSAKMIRERMSPFVKYIREKHPSTPIIIIQSPIRETTVFDLKNRQSELEKRTAAKEEAEKLIKEGVGDLYFIDEDQFLGVDHNGTVDGSHPTDVGFDRMVKKLQPKILKILAKYNIKPLY